MRLTSYSLLAALLFSPSLLAAGNSGNTSGPGGNFESLRDLYPLGSHWFDPAAVNVLSARETSFGGIRALQIKYESQVHHGQAWQHDGLLFVPTQGTVPDTLFVMHSSVLNERAGMPFVQGALNKGLAVFAITSGNPGNGYYGVSGGGHVSQIMRLLTDVYARSGDPRDLPHVLMANSALKGMAAAEQVLGRPFAANIQFGVSKYAVSAMIAGGAHPRTIGINTMSYDHGHGELAQSLYTKRTNGGTFKIKDFGDPWLERQYALIYDPWEFRQELVGKSHVYSAGTNDPTRIGIWLSEGYFQKMRHSGYSIARWYNPGGGHAPNANGFYCSFLMSLDHFVDGRPLPRIELDRAERTPGALTLHAVGQNVPPSATVKVVFASDPRGVYSNSGTVWGEVVAKPQGQGWSATIPALQDRYVWYFFQIEDNGRTATASDGYEKLYGE